MCVAAHLFLVRHNQILMQRRKNTGFGDGGYAVLSGHVEEDERITESLVREAFEEANIIMEPVDLTFVHVMQTKLSGWPLYLHFFFISNKWKGEIQNREPAKCDDLRWFNIGSLPNETIDHIREVIVICRENKGLYFSEDGWNITDESSGGAARVVNR